MSHGGLAPTFSPLHLTVCVSFRYLLASDSCTVKNIHISVDILWRVFCYIFMEPVPYTFLSVSRWWNNEVQAHTAMCTNDSLFRQFTDTNIYGIGSVKI